MMQLRRISDRVPLRRITDRVARTGSEAAAQVGQKLSEVSKRSNEAAQTAFSYAMSHRKATAVVLGATVAAALLWMMQRSASYSGMRRKVVRRVRAASR